MIAKLSGALLALLLLAGCSTANPVEQLAPSPAPSPSQLPQTFQGTITDASVQPASVPAVAPVRVRVPSVGIDIESFPVGVEPDGLMELPKNIFVAGWYRFGSDPTSDAGTTVISAHVDDFEQGLGPFAFLKQLTPGAEIIVTAADGKDYRYAVESVQNVNRQQLPVDQVFDRAGAPRLVLITCGGQFDDNVFEYSDNVVVVATPISS